MKFPRIPEEADRRKKLTVRKMVIDLINYGFTYRELARIFGVSYSLFGKYKSGLEIENAKRKKYRMQKGTKDDRQYRRLIKGEKMLAYERLWHKKRIDKNRKHKFTPRFSMRKNEKTKM
jgi:hypothetical protein